MWLSESARRIEGAFRDLRPHLKIGAPEGSYIWVVNASGGEWYVAESGQKSLDKIERMLYAGGGVSESDIQGILTDFIFKLLFNPKEASYEYLLSILQSIENDIKQREFCIAIFGLEIEGDLTFDFGDLSFHGKNLDGSGSYGSELEPSVRYSWGCLSKEGTQLYMQDISHLTVLEHALALEYLYNLFETDYPEDVAAHFSLSWSPESSLESMEIYRIKGHQGFGRSSGRRPIHDNRSVKVTSSQIEKWKKSNAFKKMNQLLRENGEMRKRVMVAISFLHDSYNEERHDFKILKNVIGIEALLGTSEDNHLGRIASSLAEKVAFLLETDLVKRLEVVKHMKSLYSLRSGIGHGQGSGSDTYDLFSAEIMSGEFLVAIINAFLKLYDEEDGFKNISDIDEWYKKKKMA